MGISSLLPDESLRNTDNWFEWFENENVIVQSYYVGLVMSQTLKRSHPDCQIFWCYHELMKPVCEGTAPGQIQHEMMNEKATPRSQPGRTWDGLCPGLLPLARIRSWIEEYNDFLNRLPSLRLLRPSAYAWAGQSWLSDVSPSTWLSANACQAASWPAICCSIQRRSTSSAFCSVCLQHQPVCPAGLPAATFPLEASVFRFPSVLWSARFLDQPLAGRSVALRTRQCWLKRRARLAASCKGTSSSLVPTVFCLQLCQSFPLMLMHDAPELEAT